MTRRSSAGLALALLALGVPACLAALVPVALTCDGSANPTGIDLAAPPLGWQLASADRGERQSAWEIKAATTLDSLRGQRPDLWDSGRVTSGRTQRIAYGGAPLASSQRVFWQVRVWDRGGQPSAWSAPASWIMGVLSPADWKGAWIAAPNLTESLLLRRDFTVGRGLRRAVIQVCGLGQYELHLDGRKVGSDFLSPGWTDYDKTALYNTYDVTAYLHPGSNAVGLLLGDGMYDVVRRNRFVKFTGFFGPLRAIVDLHLVYADGSVEDVGTDSSWRTHAGPITGGGIYSGEDFDARLVPVGWDRPGFDDREWLPAVGVLDQKARLMGHSVSAEAIGAFQVQRPVAERDFPDGSVVYDLGQNAAHIPLVRVGGPAGGRVRITPSEILNADGTIDPATMGESARRGFAWCEYTKATNGVETWQPRFWYVGCRYLKVQCFPPADGSASAPARVESVAGIVVHARAPAVGEFSASNPLLGRIRDLVRWAQSSNLVSVLTDCPHRERLGWLEQDHLNGPSLRYDFDLGREFAKIEHDIADAQHPDGLVPEIAPEYLKFDPPFNTAAEWSAAFIIIPWQQYEFTGGTELLRRYYGPMTRYFAYLHSQAREGILTQGLGDWFDLPPGKKPGFAQLTPPAITATAFYYRDAWILSHAAALLGRTADAGRFGLEAERIRASFNRHFFDAANGWYGDPSTVRMGNGAGRTLQFRFPATSQCADALALDLGLPEASERPRVMAALVQQMQANGDEMTAGDVGFRFLVQALADGGRSDLVYRMIDQDQRPGYAYQLKRGATALCEAWDANDHASHDHFMLGQIIEWFYRDLAGIQPDPAGPGFKRIIIRPQPVGDLTWVQARYDSIRGPIAVRWDRREGNFLLRATLPPNTAGTVYLPVRSEALVLESGRPADSSPGVRFLGREDDCNVYAIESGTYRFEALNSP